MRIDWRVLRPRQLALPAGALLASLLLIGMLQTFFVTIDKSAVNLLSSLGVSITPDTPLYSVWSLTLAQVAPVMPYLLLVLVLIFRPKGLMGTREG